MDRIGESRVSTKRRAPAGSISSPATRRTRSPGSSSVSRPTAQRLVSLALSERLITFRLDHPIAACMELAARLTEQFELGLLRGSAVRSGLGQHGARRRGERGGVPRAEPPLADADHHSHRHRPHAACRRRADAAHDLPQHKLVSLVGHISMQGSASFYDVLARLSDLTPRAALSDAAAGRRAARARSATSSSSSSRCAGARTRARAPT